MILPGCYAIMSPLAVGLLVGPRCLAGLLGGSIVSGCMLAIMMSNAGGAWDNAKKYIEIESTKPAGFDNVYKRDEPSKVKVVPKGKKESDHDFKMFQAEIDKKTNILQVKEWK